MSARAVGRFVVTATLLCLITTGAFAATSADGLWTSVDEQTLTAFQSGRMIFPKALRAYQVDRAALAALLARAPMEFTAAAQLSSLTMTIPMPDGTFQRFRVEEAPIVAPGPLGQLPTERAYRGQGLDDPTATLRFIVLPSAIHGIILSGNGTSYIDPYSDTSPLHIMVYARRDFVTSDSFVCEVTGGSFTSSSFRIAPNFTDKNRGKTLRKHRLAMAANGEYTTYHHNRPGAKATAKDSAWELGILPTMIRVNGIYERDLSIRLELIDKTEQFKIIYDNSVTDPYANAATDIDTNQVNLDDVIGNANYDVGHVVTTGAGGIAQLRSTCVDGDKARGTTGTSTPTGDPFDVDYVAHEMGHQFGGEHTFNGNAETCGAQRSPAAAMEPGSGSTIQAYAGICSPQNLQNNSDAYFHFISLEQMANHSAGGGDCAAKTLTNNTPPVVNAGPGYIIPRSTPFQLTGSATDVDDPSGASLTYTWEEVDLGPSTDGTVDNGSSPIFRSFNPSTSPTRVFPRITDIVANKATYGEIMPVTDRTMKFKLTVRDNDARGGAINDGGTSAGNGDVLIDVDPTKGPFLVVEPNAKVAWGMGTTRQVRWDVAGTDTIPGAANVDIHLSTDGGLTYPTLLLADTPNDGAATVTVPNTPSTTARIRVMGADNVFFDISNADFTITSPGANIAIGGTAVTAENCAPGNEALDPGETVTVNFTLRNVGAGTTGNLIATLQPTGGITSPSAPQNYGSIGFEGSATRAYTFTVDPTFACGTVVTASFLLTDGLTTLGTISQTFTVGETNTVRTVANSTPLVVATDPGAGPSDPYPSPITVSGFTPAVTKVTVTLHGFSAPFSDDHDLLLVGPTGQSVLLMSDTGGNFSPNTVTLTFDDSAASKLPDAGAYASGSYKPSDYVSMTQGVVPMPDAFPGAPVAPNSYGATLSLFNDLDPNGTWNLYWVDDGASDGGTLAGGWSLTLHSVKQACCSLSGAGTISFQSANFNGAENGGPATVTVQRTGGIRGIVRVNYATADGTASSTDYQASSGTLTFADGQQTATFTVPISQDTMVEPNETIELTLTVPAGGTGGATLGTLTEATLTILDDDAPAVASLSRGPYLQMASSSSIVVRWRTDVATDSTVRYGTAANSLNLQASNLTVAVDHQVMLTNLAPSTRYFYSVGTATRELATGDFVTAPFPGVPQSTRIWAFGDSGNANADQLAVRDSYFTFDPVRRIDVWLLLGDNAYTLGNDNDYQTTFFSRYPNVLKTTPVWSTFGNHEGLSSNSMTQQGPYYQIFNWPTLGEIGGAPSGTEAYYSFDHANVHFISLNSHDIIDRSASGDMLTWLKNDLAQNQQKWTIAFFHHPPYSFGGHNSDNPGGTQDTPESARSIKEMRENALPILEQYGVDLVLTGHSHDYERSFLVNGHYGLSSTLTESMKIDRGDGNFAAGRAYRKTSDVGSDANTGAIYAVVGSASTATPVTKHPVMVTAQQRLGSLVVDVNGDRLDAFFLGKSDAGTYTKLDEFTILKGYPDAFDDRAVTPQNTAVTIDVLANDTDPEGDRIFISQAPVTAPENGSVAINGTTLTYTPDSGFFGLDSFTYRVSDNNGRTDDATVFVSVTSPAGLFLFATPSYTVGEGDGRIDLTVNRIDGSQGSVTVTYATQDGSANAPGDYTAATGFLTFAAGETTKTFSINITNDTATESPEVFTVTLTNVDAGGIGTPAVAVVAITDDDVPCASKPTDSFSDDFEPTPNPGWTVDTAVNGSAPAIAGWTHTQDPNAHSSSHSYFSQSAQGVPEGLDGSKDDRLVSPPLNISSTTQLKFWHSFNHEDTYDGGVVEVSTDGLNWVNLLRGDFVSGGYPEDSASAAGNDSWTGISPDYPEMNEVVVNLGAYAGNNVRLRWRHVQDTNLGVVGWYVDDIEFTNLNEPGDPPVAADDTANTTRNTPVTITVLGNDTDPDNTALSVRESSASANGGTTSVNADNTILYTPPTGFTGTDTFTYIARNVAACYDLATVTVTVTAPPNTVPDAVNDTATTATSTPVVISVLANDTDVDNDTLTITAVTQGANGSVTTNGTTVTYTPNNGFTGTDAFTYTTSDGQGTDSATVSVTVTGGPTPGSLHFSAAAYQVGEAGGLTTITVTRSGGSAGTVGVNYSTTNGSATAGSDYTAASGTLTFADGVTSQSFTVAITNDTLDEVDETISLNLSNATNGATLGAPAAAVLTILDDDAGILPSISSISPSSVCQGGPSFTLTVNGTNFQNGAFVQVNGSNRGTTFVNAGQLTAMISSADIAVAGGMSIRVVNPGPANSNDTTLTVASDFTAPTVTAPAAITVMQTSCSANNDGGASGTTSAAIAGFLSGGAGADNCSQSATRLSPQANGVDVNNGTFLPGGTTTVTFRFRDNAGNIGTATSTVTVRLLGDLNLDVVVDSPDHVILANYLVDNVEPGSVPFTAAAESADLNRDHEIDAVDLVIIANHLVDNIPCLSN